MGIVSAIARVRAGAKSAGLEGALNSLGAELKSDAIPGRLRDVAGRLAALLDRNQVATGQAPVAVASLERALDQQAAQRAAHASVSAHASAAPDAVCPFTGLRADEMGVPAVAPAAAPMKAVALEPSASVSVAPAEAAVPAALDRAPLAAEEPAAPVETAKAAAPRGSEAGSRVSSAGAKRRRAVVDTGTREKRKERLAGSASVANTSGRSATRPAAKRPRSRAEDTRKKK